MVKEYKMNKLVRPKNRNLFGVCSALSNYFGLNLTVVRILCVLGTIFTGSIIFWIYIILALIIPSEE